MPGVGGFSDYLGMHTVRNPVAVEYSLYDLACLKVLCIYTAKLVTKAKKSKTNKDFLVPYKK